jgi:hypothetical protein
VEPLKVAKSRISHAPKSKSLPGISANTIETGLSLLSDIVNFIPDATFVIDTRGKVIAWNKAMEKLTGILKEEIIGKGDYAYAVPFYGKRRPMLIDVALDTQAASVYAPDSIAVDGEVLSIQTFVPTAKGGQGVCLSCAASALRDSAKSPIGAIESIRDITSHRRLEQTSHQRGKNCKDIAGRLEEISTALKVLLDNGEDGREKLQDHIQANLRSLILPYLEKVKKGSLDQDQRTYLELIESSLQKIFSPCISNMNSAFNCLTPMEIEVANLVREGKTGKEIATLLGIAYKTVETHRYKLRMKLGIRNAKANLRSFLISIA